MRAIAPMRLTHHWYAPYIPACLNTFPIVNTRLTPFACLTCLCSFTFINKHLMHLCFVLLQILLCLLGPVQKSNIVRNEHGHTQRCEFSVIDKKHPFWTNLAQKIKIVSPSYNLVPKPIRICRIRWWWSLPFLTENTCLFWGKFGPISQNCQFLLKFGTQTNLNMNNSMVMLIFSVFEKYLLGKFGREKQKFQFKLKFGT